MKAGWKIAKLGDVCHVYQPETLSQKQLKDGPYPVYGANGQIGFHNEFNHAEPQLTLGCRGTCGVVNWTTENAWINGNAMVVKAVEELVIPQFLSYALKGGINIGDSISGTAQPQITRKSLTPIEIPLPPLAEQKRIVALLDEAFAGIDEAKAKAEAKTLQLESFIPSAWSSLLPTTLNKWPEAKASPDPELPIGWSIKTIAEISEKDGPVRYGILQPGPHVENGIPYVRPTEIVNDLIPEGSLRRTSTKIASMYSRSVLKPNDVILTIVGTIGKVALVPKWLEGGNVTQSSARIRPDATQCSPEYLAAMLRSPLLRRQFEHYRMGAAVTRLNIADVKTLRIPLPSLSIQSSVVKSLDSFKAHHAILSDNNDLIYRKLASLKSSILEKAFAGELTA